MNLRNIMKYNNTAFWYISLFSVLLSAKVSRVEYHSECTMQRKIDDKNAARQKGSLRSASIKSISVSKNTAAMDFLGISSGEAICCNFLAVEQEKMSSIYFGLIKNPQVGSGRVFGYTTHHHYMKFFLPPSFKHQPFDKVKKERAI